MTWTGTASSQTVSLKMHTFVPPVAGSYKNLDWWRKKVEAESNGTLKIQLYGSMQLGGKPSDLYDQVRNGVVDIVWVLPGYKEGLFPRIGVFELPFIGDTADIVAPAIDEYVRKWGKEEWGAVRVITAHTGGASVLHVKGNPIRTVDDFKGRKIRTPSRVSSKALVALGATPVPIPSLKMTEAFMRNVVDAVVAPWTIALAIRLIDTADNHTESTLHEPTLILLMNKDSYAKLPDAAKKAIDTNSGEKIAKAFAARWMKDDAPAHAKAKKLGKPVYTLSKEEAARWRKTVQPVYDDWVKEMTEKGHPGKELLADAERLIEKYRAEVKK
jgi:TRAP-type C4-dicarboxylate transport system substrate-binding protein